jgi:hypothetical protein
MRRREFLRQALGTTALAATSGWMHAPAVIGGEKP